MRTTAQKLRFLTAYATIMTVLLTSLVLFSFHKINKIENFEEINVKRINILENDGTIRMVISNKEKQHSGRMDGKDWEKRERPSGMIFFNDEGDECGGLIYQAKKTEKGIVTGMSITMDQYKNDQVLQLSNQEFVKDGKLTSQRGIHINAINYESKANLTKQLIEEANKIEDTKLRNTKLNEIYKEHTSKNLLFLGKTKGNSQGLFISDPQGNPKMMIYVDDKGEPKIQTLNEKGEVKDFLILEK
jgi:hypothetical protein